MSAANDAAIGTMGETITIGGVELLGVVDTLDIEQGQSAGGTRTVIACEVLVPGTTVLRDGMPVSVRGAAGKVVSWKLLGPDGHKQVSIGPVNRWSGEIPGV